jgi:DNA-binding NarL/FixJ family response regulator
MVYPVPDRSSQGEVSSGHPIRVLIADDHALLRQLLRHQLEGQDEVEVISDVGTGREAIEAAETLLPDVVLMDLAMPGLNGIEATRQIRKRLPKTKVLILTGYMDDDRVVDALRADAAGYIVKQSPVKELLLAIQVVHRGNKYFSAALSESGIDDYIWQAKQPEEKVGFEALTSREREVLQLIAEGHSNQKIAQKLVISIKTVEAHRSNIMTKLKAQNRTDLIRFALRKGLIESDSDVDITDTQ